MPKFLVIGHLTPTDGDPDPVVQGKLDSTIQVAVFSNRPQAERALLWYQDGVIVPAPAEEDSA